MSGSDIPAGWYPDPEGRPADRYWDGSAWTADTRPQAPPAPTSTAATSTSPAAPARPRSRAGVWVAVAALVVLVVAVGAYALHRKQVDDAARRAADIGSNMGGPANPLQTMYDVLCPDGPATAAPPGVDCSSPPPGR